ncbi:hypothetical protein [Streptomyces sp. NPDC049040]|uniref:hypothetical protein n=1 Tax=Streptomyces sp. NPDC049040 TaxID=3365593 RepID=UPI00371B832A
MVDVHVFVPAEFDLYEFDEGKAGEGRSPGGRRWFGHWDGLIGEPAEEVHLGWSSGGAVAIVCTSGRSYGRAEARSRAAHLALGGDALPIPGRPQGPRATHEAIEGFEGSGLWTGGSAPDQEDFAETAAPDGFSIGYRRLEGGIVFIAAVNVDPARFGIRRVQDWSVYDVDARTGFPLGAPRGG